MFDFGFWELILIMLVALVVVGPKRLPRLAAQVGEWVGRMRALVNQFRQNIQQEVQTEELRDVLRQQQNQIQELQDIVQDATSPKDTLTEAIERQLEARPNPDAADSEDEGGSSRDPRDS